MTFASPLSGSNSGGLTKVGSGTLVLTASNAYSGPTTVNDGSLVGNTSSLPTPISLANEERPARSPRPMRAR